MTSCYARGVQLAAMSMNPFSYSVSIVHEREKNFAAAHGAESSVISRALGRLGSIRETLIAPDAPDDLKLAVWIVAPVLAGFAAWLAKNIHAQGAYPLGVMREGRLLCQLMRDLFGIESHEADFNRSLTMLAAADCGDDEALVNWLTRTRLKLVTHGELGKMLPDYVMRPWQESLPIDTAAAQALVAGWRKLSVDSPVHNATSAAHAGVWKQWQNLKSSASGQPIALMDFACAGNIQRSLQKILTHHGDTTPLTGLNFVTTRGTAWAKQQGCALYGFLAEDGQPEWIADAYAHAPDVIEIFAAAPVGALRGYDKNGQGMRAAPLMTEAQRRTVETWQHHILKAAKMMHDDIGSDLTAELCRCLWGRLLIDPLPAEVMALADWPVDSGLEDNAPRPLAPRLEGKAEDWTRMQTGWPHASVSRQKLYNETQEDL